MLHQKKLIVDYVHDAVIPLLDDDKQIRHLDVSAGWGDLIKKLSATFPNIQSEACDYPIAPELDGIPTKEANLHHGKLPFDDKTFDLITCTEAFEHIENHHPILREILRILKPGGMVAISVPNIRNFRSRLKFLARGTYEYFDPLSTVRDLGPHAWMRHINPFTYYHLALAMLDSGFESPQHHSGKVQKLSACFYWITPILRMNVRSARRMRKRKGINVTPESEDLAEEYNSRNIFTSRTLIVTARKPETPSKVSAAEHYEPAPRPA